MKIRTRGVTSRIEQESGRCRRNMDDNGAGVGGTGGWRGAGEWLNWTGFTTPMWRCHRNGEHQVS